MFTKPELHPVQIKILKALLFSPSARFSDLNLTDLTSDHFNFHLKRLLQENIVQKLPNRQYTLTATGKEFANRLDTDHEVIERQAKIAVLVGATRFSQGVRQYLIQQRLKQPYFGYHGFLSGKIRWGETVIEAAARELLEETGLTGKITLVGIKHKMDYSPAKLLLEDKYFYVCRVDNPTGNLLTKFSGGKNLWLSVPHILKLDHQFDGVKETIDFINQPKLTFSETKYVVSGY